MEAGALRVLVVNHCLREVEAASALDVAAFAGISGVGSRRAAPSGLADFALRDAIADTNDHGDLYNR